MQKNGVKICIYEKNVVPLQAEMSHIWKKKNKTN